MVTHTMVIDEHTLGEIETNKFASRQAGAITTRVLVLSKMIKMNMIKTLYSSTDFPVLLLLCSVLTPALLQGAVVSSRIF